MIIYVFGNEDEETDNKAIKIAKWIEGSNDRVVDGDLELLALRQKVKHAVEEVGGRKVVEFVFVKPNEDLPFVGKKEVIILDVVEGLKEVKVFALGKEAEVKLGPRNSVHDYDLGFQLKYLQKIGKLGKVRVIGVPG